MAFDPARFLPREVMERINEIKTYYPEVIAGEAAGRIPPARVPGAMVLAAADHNARMICAYGGDPVGLGNRREYLARLVRILLSEKVRGVEAAPDVLEELLALNSLTKQRRGIDFLKGKLLIGTANRGGLKDTAWELDDQALCYTVEKLVRLGLDGVKCMLRIHPGREACKHTLHYCAEVVNQADRQGLDIFLEVLYLGGEEGAYRIRTDLESLCKSVGVASALGCTSLRKWLELPLGPEYCKAAEATSSSILVVPDEVASGAEAVVAEYTAQRGTAPNVRGILLGRNVLYGEDPFRIAEAVADVWWTGCDLEEAYERAARKVVIDEC